MENSKILVTGVVCDMCGKDYTNSDEQGGFLFSSKAVCPDCAPGIEESAKKYKEEKYIVARCPKGKSFRDWVVQDLRGDEPAFIETQTFDTNEEFLAAVKMSTDNYDPKNLLK